MYSKNKIIDRYERTSDGKVYIDVGVRTIEHLYDNFDNTASYLKKDLDSDFVEYLIKCVKEIGNHKFIIRVALEECGEKSKERRLRKSIRNYFSYLEEIENRNFRVFYKKNLFFFGLGIGLILLSIQFPSWLFGSIPVIRSVAGEGVTIAAWVLMWEVFADLMVHWFPMRHQKIVCRRLSAALVFFDTSP